MVKIVMCKHHGVPCVRYHPNVENSCFIWTKGGKAAYACVLIRFKGKNSVAEKGFGMTILEKLKRQGLLPK